MLKAFVGGLLVAAMAMGGAWWAWQEGHVPGNPLSPRPENLKRALRTVATTSAAQACVRLNEQQAPSAALPFDHSPAGYRVQARQGGEGSKAADALVAAGLLRSELAGGVTQYTMTWDGFGQTDGTGCFVFHSGSDAVELIRVQRKPPREGNRVLEVVYRRTPVITAEWAKREDVQAAFPAIKAAIEPAPATVELVQSPSGWVVLARRGPEGVPQADPFALAAIAGTITPDRARELFDAALAMQPFCVEIPARGDHLAGSPPDAEIFLFNFLGPAAFPDGMRREAVYAHLNALARAGLMEERLYRLEQVSGTPAAGAVGFVATERAKKLMPQWGSACIPIGRTVIDEILRVEQFGPGNPTPRVMARARVQLDDASFAKLVQEIPHLKRMLDVGIGVSGQFTVRDGALQIAGYRPHFLRARFDSAATGRALPVVEVGPWVPGFAPAVAAAPAPARTIETAAWRAAGTPRVVWVGADPFIHGNSPISNSGLTLAHGNVGPLTTARSSEGKTRGKWYFELLLTTSGAGVAPGTYTAFGIRDIELAQPGAVAMPSGSRTYSGNAPIVPNPVRTVTGFDGRGPQKAAHGDVFGVALDLDRMRVSMHRNGVWYLGGAPSEESGVALLSGRPYVAYASAGQGTAGREFKDAWTANFGGRPFQYSLPRGYRPYDGR